MAKRQLRLRPEVAAFAQEMERKLRANDWKGGWKDNDVRGLMARVVEELAEVIPTVGQDPTAVELLELVSAKLEDMLPRRRKMSPRRVLEESADVANMLM